MVRLKKIPEESREKVNAFFKKQLNNMEAAIKEAFNAEVVLEYSKPRMATVPDIAEIVGGISLISKLAINGIEKGEVFFIADPTAVHVLTGIMMISPEDEIKSNIEQGKLSSEDEENFEEFVGYLAGGVTQTLGMVFSREYVLEHKETSQAEFKPDVKSLENLPVDDYLITTYLYKPDDYPEISFHLIIPRISGENLFVCSLEPEIDWSDRTIVVVYDTHKSDREIICQILESENIGVADFNSLKDLIRSILREEVDIVIMEVKPNDWDSLMVSKKIRKSTKAMNIPFILTLEDPTNEVIFMAYKAGIRHFLVKPLKKKELLDKVKELCA
ncbi:response regulator [bacterium]|nr:response regulator [bacterium]